jgi:hypothetical protein
MQTRNSDSDVTLDHAVIVGSTLDRLVEAFDTLGLEAEYAGALENEINHLSQLAFPDGSYFELLSTLEPDQESPWWNDHLKREGGPCAFALESEDIAADTDRIRDAEIPVDGPTEYGRERPNGTYFEYELSIVGDGGVATKFPFLIDDHTPRSKRVQWPSPTVSETSLTGIAFVIVAVEDLENASAEYEAAYGLSEPAQHEIPSLGGTAHHFPSTPIVLATPTDEESWLADRLETHGERPAAFLLGTDSVEESLDRFDLDETESLLGYDCGWLNSDDLDSIQTRLGIVGKK